MGTPKAVRKKKKNMMVFPLKPRSNATRLKFCETCSSFE